MSAITPDWYNNFGKASYINLSYIPETFCIGSVGQYIFTHTWRPKYTHAKKKKATLSFV